MYWLAPVIFNLFVSAVFHVAHADSGRGSGNPVRYKYDGVGLFNFARLKSRTRCESVGVTELQYADDAAFFNHTVSELQCVVSDVRSTNTNPWLSMNLTKFEVLERHIVQQSETPRILVDSAELLVTERFTHLGSVITSDRSQDEEVSCRIGFESSFFGRLTHLVFVNLRLSLATKRFVYRVSCISILIFGYETWALFRRHYHKLVFFHGKCIQMNLRVKWVSPSTTCRVSKAYRHAAP